MSWLFNPTGDPPPRRADEQPAQEMAPDYSGRMVSTRKANQPFLAYTRYREEQKRLHEEWLERKKLREEKLARGEEVGPEEPDPTAQEEVGLLGLLKFIVYCLLFLALVSKFFTGSFVFDLESKLPTLKSLLPRNERLLSEEGLSKYDGSDPSKPIYLAIDGLVYDVTEGRRMYGPGGSYHFMYVQWIRQSLLINKSVLGLEHWKNFYANHKKYTKIGRVLHHPIDPLSPIPPPCKEEKPAVGNKEQAKEERPTKDSGQHAKHQEL
ncbi:cytochrome b5 [Sanghuangporus baumii]|uniref:Cytochrome b5 n=1 Tax=Sanghuangporus baumii TaxID=108892 RepID=A0A9Q5N3L5_SANBA|nr:cytochrome b5 [Sanghuangporus baumii]